MAKRPEVSSSVLLFLCCLSPLELCLLQVSTILQAPLPQTFLSIPIIHPTVAAGLWSHQAPCLAYTLFLIPKGAGPRLCGASFCPFSDSRPPPSQRPELHSTSAFPLLVPARPLTAHDGPRRMQCSRESHRRMLPFFSRMKPPRSAPHGSNLVDSGFGARALGWPAWPLFGVGSRPAAVRLGEFTPNSLRDCI